MPLPNPPAHSARPRAFSPGEIVTREARQSNADPYEFILSTDDVDRMGDIVEIGGIDTTAFEANSVALWQHDPTRPIGKWLDLRKTAGKLIGKLLLLQHDPFVERVRQMIEQRIIQAVSIGFRAIAAEPIGEGFGLRFTRSELVEASLVSIPANPNALRLRALAPHPADAEIFSGQAGALDSNSRIRADQPSPRRQLASPPRGPPMENLSISERLGALRTRSHSVDVELERIDQEANDNGRAFTVEEMTQIESLDAEKKLLAGQIRANEVIEANMAARAIPIGGGSSPSTALVPYGATAGARLRVEPRARVQEKPGAMLGKLVTVAWLARAQGREPANIIAERYGDDDRLPGCFNYLQRAATSIADTTTPGWAAELVQQNVAAFMDDLVTLSVFATLRSRASVISLSLDGTGSISIPSRVANSQMGGSWVGETGVIPVVQGTMQAKKLEPTKLAAITTFSKELMTATNDTIETVLTDGLRNDTAIKLDRFLLDNIAKVAGVRPAGLRQGANTAASGGATAVAADMAAAIAPILAAGGGRDLVILMNTAQRNSLAFSRNMYGAWAFPELANNMFQVYPVIASNNVPAGVVFVLDAADFANAAGVPEIQASEEATLTMANANMSVPSQALDASHAIGTLDQVLPDGGIAVVGPGGTGTIGYQAMNMFQQYSVAVRLVMPVNWIMRRDNMVSTITGVAWS